MTAKNSKLLKGKTMNSCNFGNKKLKVGWTGMAQSGQKRLIFIVVPQLRMAHGSGFLKKIIVIIIIRIVIIMIMQQKPKKTIVTVISVYSYR